MSLLSLIQGAALKIGIAVPDSVFGNSDLEAQELLAFAQEEGRELVKRGDWRLLRKELSFVTFNQEEQTNFYPADCDHIVQDTMWNRSKRRPVFGPVTPQEWQAIKAMTTSPVMDTVFFRGNNALIQPVPPAGQTIACEYISKSFCQSSASSAQSAWMQDTDTGLLDENVMMLGVILRYKLAKGLDASAALAQYETQVQQAITQDKPSKTVDLASGNRYARVPGVVVPEGSWMQ